MSAETSRAARPASGPDRRGTASSTPSAAGASPPRTSAAIDLIRVLSMLWVVGCWHVFDYLPDVAGLRNAATYRVTVTCLALFVLVSGYLLGRSRPGRAPGVRDFYLQRFGRVYPPFVIASLGFWAVRLDSAGPLLKGIALIGVLWGPLPHTLWFMVMICAFYAVTPALRGLRERTMPYALIVAGVTVLLGLASRAIGDPDPRVAIYWPLYALGLWLGAAPERVARGRWMFAIAAAAMLAVSLLAFPDATDQSVAMLPLAFTIAPAILAFAMRADPVLPRWPLVTKLAAASFFAYLFHRIAYAIALHVVHPAAPAARVLLLTGLCLPVLTVCCYYGQQIYNAAWTRLTR